MDMTMISQEKLVTLNRMRNGTDYKLRGDKAVGVEVRHDNVRKKRKEVTCRSLAPLMREGLIDFVVIVSDMTRYYEVRLTEEGEKVIRSKPR
jgi:hypothetical protein